MAVLMIGEVPNLTEEVYAAMVGNMMPLMRASKGFISHAGGPHPAGGWRVVEVWESEEDGQTWFEQNVKPNLPPDVVPDRTYFPLHTAFHEVADQSGWSSISVPGQPISRSQSSDRCVATVSNPALT